MISNTKLANSWPWSKEWIALAFWLPGLTGLILMYIMLPVIGKHAYWFGLINLWGLFFCVIYGYVSNKINIKKQRLIDKGLKPFDGLTAFGKMQAPAAIAIDKETIYFYPIIGKELHYDIKKIKKIELKSSLPGKQLLFKKAYHLTLDNDAIFAFAVNNELSHGIQPFFQKIGQFT